MKTSANGRKLIEQFEGLELKAYDDGTGTWTIGYGHTSAAGLPRVVPRMVITQEQADAILEADLASVEADITHHVTAQLNQNQFDALVSFDFNTGALDRSSLLWVINNHHGDITAAFETWRFAKIGGVEQPILLSRRQKEAALYLTPEA